MFNRSGAAFTAAYTAARARVTTCLQRCLISHRYIPHARCAAGVYDDDYDGYDVRDGAVPLCQLIYSAITARLRRHFAAALSATAVPSPAAKHDGVI